MQTEYDFVWPQPQSLIQSSELPSPSQPQTSSQDPQDPLKNPYSLWVSTWQAELEKRSPKISSGVNKNVPSRGKNEKMGLNQNNLLHYCLENL